MKPKFMKKASSKFVVLHRLSSGVELDVEAAHCPKKGVAVIR